MSDSTSMNAGWLPTVASRIMDVSPSSRRKHRMDVQWVQRLFIAYLQGDERAFAEFYTRMYPLLRSWLWRRVPPDEVDDLIQEFFMRLHERRHLLNTERPIFPYMRKMVNNLLMDYYRKRAMERYRAEWAMEEIATPSISEDSWTWQDLLRHLPQEDQEFIRQHFFERRSIQEIAQYNGLRPGTLRVRKFRLIRKIRKMLKGVV